MPTKVKLGVSETGFLNLRNKQKS